MTPIELPKMPKCPHCRISRNVKMHALQAPGLTERSFYCDFCEVSFVWEDRHKDPYHMESQ